MLQADIDLKYKYAELEDCDHSYGNPDDAEEYWHSGTKRNGMKQEKPDDWFFADLIEPGNLNEIAYLKPKK